MVVSERSFVEDQALGRGYLRLMTPFIRVRVALTVPLTYLTGGTSGSRQTRIRLRWRLFMLASSTEVGHNASAVSGFLLLLTGIINDYEYQYPQSLPQSQSPLALVA